MLKTMMIALGAIASTAATAAPFNGFFAGPDAGWQRDKLRIALQNAPPPLPLNTEVRTSGLMLGGHVGFDLKLLKLIVIGGEVQASWRSDSGNRTVPGIASFDAEPIRTYGGGARAGLLVTPGTLVYGRANYARLDYRLRYRLGYFVPETRGSVERELPELVYGGGLEQRLDSHSSIRVEYLHSRADKDRLTSAFGLDPSARFTRDQISAGFSYYF